MFETGGKWHRYLALGLLLYMLYLFFILFVSPVLEASFEAEDRYLNSVDQLNKYQMMASSNEMEQTNNNTLKEAINTETRVLKATTPDEAQKSLQQLIVQIARQAGAGIGRSVPAEPSHKQNQRVYTQIQLTTTHQGLLDLLFALENNDPKIFIDDLKIEARNQRVNQPVKRAVSLNVVLSCSAIWFEMKGGR